jgi:membrane protease YdiL (CAAX protease family)
MATTRAVPPSRRLAHFAGLVLGLEVVAVLMSPDPDVLPFVLVLIPATAAIVVAAFDGGRAAVRRLTGRVVRIRVEMRWYIVAVGIPVADKLLVDLAGTLLGKTDPERLVQAITTTAIVIPLVVFIPGLLEELGWRGFGVQTAIEQGHSPFWAVAVIGPLFIALHLPLYLPGQLYAGSALWPLPINLLAVSVLLTWIYLRTQSVLVTGLMHASFNATVPLTWGLDAEWVWAARAITLALITALVVSRTGITWWRTPLVPAEQLSTQRRRQT